MCQEFEVCCECLYERYNKEFRKVEDHFFDHDSCHELFLPEAMSPIFQLVISHQPFERETERERARDNAMNNRFLFSEVNNCTECECLIPTKN
jgi:hypothetical protein